MCDGDQYQNKIAQRVAGINGQTAEVICCTKDGCNWNGTTARQDLSYSDITGAQLTAGNGLNGLGTVATAGLAGSWVPWVIIGAVLLGLIFCCCCFCCLK